MTLEGREQRPNRHTLRTLLAVSPIPIVGEIAFYQGQAQHQKTIEREPLPTREKITAGVITLTMRAILYCSYGTLYYQSLT